MAGRKRGRPRREAREWPVSGALAAPNEELEVQAEAGMEMLLMLMRPEMDRIFMPGVNAAWMERGVLAAMLFGGKKVTVCLDD